MTLNRRQFTQATVAWAAAGTAPLAFAADTLKIGYVSPQTGPLAPFGEADKWVIEQMKTAFKDGISVGGKKYAVQIVLKDSQSNPNRAGEVANDLILKDKVALMLTAGTPETANPVSDACELNEVPCVSSVVSATFSGPTSRSSWAKTVLSDSAVASAIAIAQLHSLPSAVSTTQFPYSGRLRSRWREV